jgi:hypothetical protein
VPRARDHRRLWREHLGRARLLLEDGPSLGTAAHVRLVDDVAAEIRARFPRPGGAVIGVAEARVLAALIVGLGIEIGRLVLGGGGRATPPAAARLIDLAARAAGSRGMP